MSDEHLVKVFTKLMLQGNVRAAVLRITERAGGGFLDQSDSVVSALQAKHPDPQIPPDSVLNNCDNLPYLEDTENTAAYVQFIASCIQGGAGCQSVHWRDALIAAGYEAITSYMKKPCYK